MSRPIILVGLLFAGALVPALVVPSLAAAEAGVVDDEGGAASGPSDGAPAPEYLSDSERDEVGDSSSWTERPSPWGESTYQGLLAAGYLLAIPSSFMTGGVGMLLPVGMHYYHGNPDGGIRALFGILGGLALGGVAGGLLDQPEGDFAITRGMLVGAASGFFAWGLIDVAFFAEHERPGDDDRVSLSVDFDPGAGVAAMRVYGAL